MGILSMNIQMQTINEYFYIHFHPPGCRFHFVAVLVVRLVQLPRQTEMT